MMGGRRCDMQQRKLQEGFEPGSAAYVAPARSHLVMLNVAEL